jgi:hypothetical protein
MGQLKRTVIEQAGVSAKPQTCLRISSEGKKSRSLKTIPVKKVLRVSEWEL